jgi:hypothetical protein
MCALWTFLVTVLCSSKHDWLAIILSSLGWIGTSHTVKRKIVSLITFSNLLKQISKRRSVHAHTFPSSHIQNLLSPFLIFVIYNQYE